jgi:DNA modification methylase
MRKEVWTNQKQLSLFSGMGNLGRAGAGYHGISSERLPTNTTTANHAIHRWFNFIAGFSPEFVDKVCRDSLADRRPALLLDPFAGCGTALLEAVAQEIDAIGYEAHPFFERICRAKLSGPEALPRLGAIESALAAGFERPAPLCVLGNAQRAFLEKLFPRDVLPQLLGARENLVALALDNDPLAFLVLARTLELSSHSATDGIYKAPTSKKRAFSPAAAAALVCHMVRADLESISTAPLPPVARIFGKSSEEMAELSDASVSIVVTSPPYLNNFDYAEMTRMQLYFWGMAASWGEITEKVRNRLIVNTTTALKGHRRLQQDYRSEIPAVVQDELAQVVRALRERRTQKAGKKEYDLLVYPYFAQLGRVFRECLRVLRSGAPLHIMVADSALYGVHIKTPQLLSRLLEDLGFSAVQCSLVRKRGQRWLLEKREGAGERLGEYHLQANR